MFRDMRKKELDQSYILNTKASQKEYINKITLSALGFHSDNAKKNRLLSHLCKFCYYINTSRIGGCAITTVKCSKCEKEISFGNTCVDVLCRECAEEYKLCKHCGLKV